MLPSAKKRHKLALEPISIDELYESSTMKGLLTFMEPLPSLNHIEVSPDVSHEVSPDSSVSKSLIHNPSRQLSADRSQETSADRSPPHRGRLFQLKKGSDALIPEEQLLYQYMWNNGRPVAGTAMVRTFTGALSLLTKEIKRGDDRSTKRVVDTLIKKLAISIARRESHNHLMPRIYYVFHWNEIQARQKRQGWTWAIKNRGIQLLTEQEAGQIQQTQKQTRTEQVTLRGVECGQLAALDILLGPSPDSSDEASGDNSDQPSGDNSQKVSGDSLRQLSSDSGDNHPQVSGDSSTPYPNKTLKGRQHREEQSPTNDSAAVASLVAILQQTLGHADDEAARRILLLCRQEAPAAPLEHILHFTALTAQRMRSMKNVTNPMGLVIRHTPKHFSGESYTQFAAQDTRRKIEEGERQRRIQQELLADARKILTDPKATKEDLAFAQDILAEAGEQGGAE